jgi:Uma2 family endonuclease
MPVLLVHPCAFDSAPLRCDLPANLDVMDDAAFFDWCQTNEHWRIERTAKGEIEIMSPAGWETGGRNAEITYQLLAWARQDQRGIASDSSTGYILPNRSERSPDASWTSKARLRSVSEAARRQFLPLCPDFVIELRSPSDRLSGLMLKMEEYLANGASLGWLVDPQERAVHVYRPSQPPEVLEEPATVVGEGPVRGFVLELKPVFDFEI